MKTIYQIVLLFGVFISCNINPDVKTAVLDNDFKLENIASVASRITELKDGGYQIFEYVDEESGDTIIMQEYYMAFLKRGPNQNQSKTEADSLQKRA
jgi:type III secretory pathway component EscR